MANIPEYRCSNCGHLKPRDQLTVKRVQFTEMGAGASILKSRVMAWLCSLCLGQDTDYMREKGEFQHAG